MWWKEIKKKEGRKKETHTHTDWLSHSISIYEQTITRAWSSRKRGIGFFSAAIEFRRAIRSPRLSDSSRRREWMKCSDFVRTRAPSINACRARFPRILPRGVWPALDSEFFWDGNRVKFIETDFPNPSIKWQAVYKILWFV